MTLNNLSTEWGLLWHENEHGEKGIMIPRQLLLPGALEKREEAQGGQSPAWYLLTFSLAASLALLGGVPLILWSHEGQELSSVRSLGKC